MKRFYKSARNALSGLCRVYKEEPNFRIHIFFLLVIVILGYYINLSPYEWIAIVVVSSLVLVTEILNSVVERIVDVIKPSTNIYIKNLKDMMASAVVVVAAASIIVGIIIFGSKLFTL